MLLSLDEIAPVAPQDRNAIEQLAQRSIRIVAARHDVIGEGDVPHFVYLLREGWACRYKALRDGRRQIVAFLIPGDLFGADVPVARAMDHSIGAITALRLSEMATADFEAMTGSRPAIGGALWRYELANASIQREWTLNIGQRTALERLAHVLLETYLRLEAAGLAADGRSDWCLTQVDLADATGLTPVHVNRTLQDLRRAGLIKLGGRSLTIPDMKALGAVALFDPDYLHFRSGKAPNARPDRRT